MSIAHQSIKRSDLNASYLQMAAGHFDKGEVEEGLLVFLAVCHEPHDDENAVYDQIARLKGLSEGATATGKLYFFDLEEKSTPAALKAAAINAHIKYLNALKTVTPSSLATKDVQSITQESSWDGYKKAALFGLGIVSVGLAVGGGIYFYRRRTSQDEEYAGLPFLPGKTEDTLIETRHKQLSSAPCRNYSGKLCALTVANEQPFNGMNDFVHSSEEMSSLSDCVMLASDQVVSSDVKESNYIYHGATGVKGANCMQDDFYRDINALQAKIASLHTNADQVKIDSIKSQIASLLAQKEQLTVDSRHALAMAILKAMGMGLMIRSLSFATGIGKSSVSSFKEFGELGHQAYDVEQEILRLQALERSLEKKQ